MGTYFVDSNTKLSIFAQKRLSELKYLRYLDIYFVEYPFRKKGGVSFSIRLSPITPCGAIELMGSNCKYSCLHPIYLSDIKSTSANNTFSDCSSRKTNTNENPIPLHLFHQNT